MQQIMDEDGFSEKRFFSDEATFFMNGTVNRQIVRIWGAENLHAFVQHIHDSPKVTVLGDRTIKIYGLFFLRRAERVSGQAGNLAHAVAVVLHLHFHPGVREFVNIKLTN